MNLNILYKLIKEEKNNLRQAKELQAKFQDMVNPQALKYVEIYLNHLIGEYKAMGGKRNVDL